MARESLPKWRVNDYGRVRSHLHLQSGANACRPKEESDFEVHFIEKKTRFLPVKIVESTFTLAERSCDCRVPPGSSQAGKRI
jgi:hypothetical protein